MAERGPKAEQGEAGAARSPARATRLPQSLRLRIMTAVVAAALVIAGVLLLGATAIAAVAAALALAGAWEWARLAGLQGSPPRLIYVALLGAVCLALWAGGEVAAQAVLALAALWWLGLTLWLAAGGRECTLATVTGPRWWALGLGLLVLPALMLAVTTLAQPGIGRGVLLYAICLVWAADIGAYFVGRAWGRRPLAPRISSGKTWEGLAGGLLAVLIYALVAAALLGVPGNALAAWAALALVAGTVSVPGDLFVSLLKRAGGLKDSGALLPGHGGLLDRIDSLLAAIPILALGLAGLPVELLP